MDERDKTEEEEEFGPAICPQCGRRTLFLQIEGVEGDTTLQRLQNPLRETWDGIFSALGRQVWICESCGFRDEISGPLGD